MRLIYIYVINIVYVDVPSNSHTDPTSTLNTDRAVYIDRAVYNRGDELPDGNTVDRMNERTEPRRGNMVQEYRKTVYRHVHEHLVHSAHYKFG
jgi:hypothetical protein